MHNDFRPGAVAKRKDVLSPSTEPTTAKPNFWRLLFAVAAVSVALAVILWCQLRGARVGTLVSYEFYYAERGWPVYWQKGHTDGAAPFTFHPGRVSPAGCAVDILASLATLVFTWMLVNRLVASAARFTLKFLLVAMLLVGLGITLMPLFDWERKPVHSALSYYAFGAPFLVCSHWILNRRRAAHTIG